MQYWRCAAEVQEQAAGKEPVPRVLDAAAVSLRSKLGESLTSVQKYATPVEEATTASLEALKAYSLGVRTAYAKEETVALPFFKRAAELDPNFAMTYARMAGAYFVSLREGCINRSGFGAHVGKGRDGSGGRSQKTEATIHSVSRLLVAGKQMKTGDPCGL